MLVLIVPMPDTPSKYRAALHYIISRSQEPVRLGAVRLCKTLWFADVMAYQRGTASISGATYVKAAHGPFPKRIRDVLDSLARDGDISIVEPQGENMVREFTCLRAPGAGGPLSDTEKRFLNAATAFVLDHTSRAISEKTHTRIWHLAGYGEPIPLYATVADPIFDFDAHSEEQEVSEEAQQWAQREISTLQAGSDPLGSAV